MKLFTIQCLITDRYLYKRGRHLYPLNWGESWLNESSHFTEGEIEAIGITKENYRIREVG